MIRTIIATPLFYLLNSEYGYLKTPYFNMGKLHKALPDIKDLKKVVANNSLFVMQIEEFHHFFLFLLQN